jgi:hypothetical protein
VRRVALYSPTSDAHRAPTRSSPATPQQALRTPDALPAPAPGRPTAPVLSSAAAAAVAVAAIASGGTVLTLTLLAALLLTSPAGRDERVALLRRRAPPGAAGGRLERPG